MTKVYCEEGYATHLSIFHWKAEEVFSPQGWISFFLDLIHYWNHWLELSMLLLLLRQLSEHGPLLLLQM